MALCRRISYLYALALLTVYALFLPLGGYERMMEGKYRAFLLLSLAAAVVHRATRAEAMAVWKSRASSQRREPKTTPPARVPKRAGRASTAAMHTDTRAMPAG